MAPSHMPFTTRAFSLSSSCGVGARAEEKSASDQAIAALTNFAIAYGGWTWETRCNTLSPADRQAFQHQIEQQLLRLHAIFDPDMVGAATEAGRETGSDPELGACDGEYKDYSNFGMDMANQVDTALKAIPADYHVTVTP